MKCPVCDIEMRVSDREGVEIDHCPQCRGVWLDRGELEKIVARAESQEYGGRRHDEDDHDDVTTRIAGMRANPDATAIPDAGRTIAADENARDS